MHKQIASLLFVVAVLSALAGCAPTAGTITGVSGQMVGAVAPDVQFTSPQGKTGEFSSVRYGLAVLAFSSNHGEKCCQLDPRVRDLSEKLWSLPVTVAQVSLPDQKCPHGPKCAAAFTDKRIITLWDVDRIAWKAYGQPAPGSVILLGPGNMVILTGSLDDPADILNEARALALDEQERTRGQRTDYCQFTPAEKGRTNLVADTSTIVER